MSSRILLITDGLDGQPGGIQRVNRSVLAAICRGSTPTDIWSLKDEGKKRQLELPEHVRVRYFAKDRREMLKWALMSREVPEDCVEIFCWHLHLVPFGRILQFRTGSRLSAFLHGIEAWRPFSWKLGWFLRGVDRFVANSAYTKRRFQEAHPGLKKKPIEVMPLGLSEEFLQVEETPRLADIKDHPFMLSVMRFEEEYKGERTLIHAFKDIYHTHPLARLVIAGDGPSRRRCEEEVKTLGLTKAVHFLGYVSDAVLNMLYRTCVGFILLSEGEGFGLVFLEAMYFSKPCIATQADAAQELVRDGESGFIVSPADVGAVELAMRRLLDDDRLCQILGSHGQEQVRRQFLPEHFYERIRKTLSR